MGIGYQTFTPSTVVRGGQQREEPAAAPPVDGPLPAPRVSVVIPALNEAKNLPYVFARFPEGIFEVILVDGGSTDGTVETARALYPGIHIVHQTGAGKGNALSDGFAVCHGEIIVMLDADGSADAAEIPLFVDALCCGADFAKGSRFLRGGGSADITRIRRLGNRGLTALVNLLYGTRYTDLCYGYNAFWARCLPRINVNCDGFEVETLINIRIAKAKLRVCEVGSFENPRIHGVSHLNPLRDGVRALRAILRERFVWHGMPVLVRSITDRTGGYRDLGAAAKHELSPDNPQVAVSSVME